MPMNRPERSTRSRTRSASSVDILRPVDRFDPVCDCQEGEDLRRPQARCRVHSLVASAHEIENCLYLAAMMLLGVVIMCMLFDDTFRRHSRIKG